MTFKEFDEYQAKLVEEVTSMTNTKGKEYTDGKDRFQNFNEEAKDLDIDRLKVAEIFLNKHMRAIKSYIRNNQVYSTEPIRGRVVDAITYLTLIIGMIEEVKEKGQPIKVMQIVANNLDKIKCNKCHITFKTNETINLLKDGTYIHSNCEIVEK